MILRKSREIFQLENISFFSNSQTLKGPCYEKLQIQIKVNFSKHLRCEIKFIYVLPRFFIDVINSLSFENYLIQIRIFAPSLGELMGNSSSEIN